MAKMGRPKKNTDELKNKLVVFRMSQKDYENLKINSDKREMALAKYCLRAVKKEMKEDEKNAG